MADYQKALGYFKEGGEGNFMNYLYDLLSSAGVAPGKVPFRAFPTQFAGTDRLPGGLKADVNLGEDILSGLLSGDTSFQDLSKEDLAQILGGEEGGLGAGIAPEEFYETQILPGQEAGNLGEDLETQKYENPQWKFEDEWHGKEDFLNILARNIQQIQEGFKAVPTPESWGLGRKIGDIQKKTGRKIKSAYEGYIPGEIASRYGSLQGKKSADIIGEQGEMDYLSDVYGLQRGEGRDIRGKYEEFGSDFYKGIQNWLSAII